MYRASGIYDICGRIKNGKLNPTLVRYRNRLLSLRPNLEPISKSDTASEIAIKPLTDYRPSIKPSNVACVSSRLYQPGRIIYKSGSRVQSGLFTKAAVTTDGQRTSDLLAPSNTVPWMHIMIYGSLEYYSRIEDKIYSLLNIASITSVPHKFSLFGWLSRFIALASSFICAFLNSFALPPSSL